MASKEEAIPMAALTFGFSAGAVAPAFWGVSWHPWGPVIGIGGAIFIACATALLITIPKPGTAATFYSLATIFCVGLFLAGACGGLALAQYGASNR